MSVFLKLKQSVKTIAPTLHPDFQTNLMVITEKEAISHWELGGDDRCFVNKIEGAPALEIYNYGTGGTINFYSYGVSPQVASLGNYTYLDTKFKPLKQKAFTVGVVFTCREGLLGVLSPFFSQNPSDDSDMFKLIDMTGETRVDGDSVNYGFKPGLEITSSVETRKLKFALYSTDGRGNAMLYSPSHKKDPVYSLWSGIVKDFPTNIMIGACGTTFHNGTTVSDMVIWDKALTIEEARLAYKRAEQRAKIRGLEMYPESTI